MFKTVNNGKLPTRATKYSACVDLYANEDVIIWAGETKRIGLGVKIDEELLYECANRMQRDSSSYQYDNFDDFLSSHYLQLAPRSSLRAKGLIVGQGYIDLDYKDEIKLIVYNPITYIEDDGHIDLQLYGNVDIHAPKTSVYERAYTIKKGDRISQITLLEHKSYLFGIESEEERIGGIGSTGNE